MPAIDINTSWTEGEIKDHIIDQIIKVVWKHAKDEDLSGYPYFNNDIWQLDLEEHRKIIADSGYINTGTNEEGKKVVIYQEDYQSLNDSVDEFVEAIKDCHYLGYTEGYNWYSMPEEGLDWIDNGDWVLDVNDFSTAGGTTTDEYGNTVYGTIDCPRDDCGWDACTCHAVIRATHSCTGGNSTSFTLTIDTPAVSPGSGTPVLDYLSQLIPLDIKSTTINPTKADEVLDTTIYELLPGIQSRQERIDKFFAEYGQLTGEIPIFDVDQNQIIDPDWDVGDPEGNDTVGNATQQYHEDNDISNPNNSVDGYITRLVRHEFDRNENQSLQWLRNNINQYLEDIDTIIDPDIEDERPDYSDISEGYLKIRGLNQGMIIRAESESTIGVENYLTDGFTIAMWVRFIDKKSGGTLFNYGNPLSSTNPIGFMLETFSVGFDDDDGSGNTFGTSYPQYFMDNQSHARFIRLVVNEGGGVLRDSHVGSDTIDRIDTVQYGIPQAFNKSIGGDGVTTNPQAMTYTQVPIDRNEWYFIVANYNATGITENEQITNSCSGDSTTCSGNGGLCDPDCFDLKNSPDYWRWNVTPGEPGTFISNSGLGAKCKVEIISKSDLLRARGYKT